jgi:hypothetical protein
MDWANLSLLLSLTFQGFGTKLEEVSTVIKNHKSSLALPTLHAVELEAIMNLSFVLLL